MARWCMWLGGMVMLGSVAMARAEGDGAVSPQPVTVPDIRGNVMRMLEAARNQGDAVVSSESSVSAVTAEEPRESSSAAQHELPPHESSTAVAPAHPEASHATPAAQARGTDSTQRAAAVPAQVRHDDHVPLEQREITIQSLEDIRQLSAELRAAKRRHEARKSAD